MPIEHILSSDVYQKLYFSFDIEDGGVVTLYTPKGAYNLSVAAAEKLMVNFEINLEMLQNYVNREGRNVEKKTT